MKNITINGQNVIARLDKEISLNNGNIILLKNNDGVKNAYMVTSFRDNKNRYGEDTGSYCSLVNLDTGYIAFEERCSRKTTVRRVLNHLLKLGNSSYSHNLTIPTECYGMYDILCLHPGEFKIDIFTTPTPSPPSCAPSIGRCSPAFSPTPVSAGFG